MNIAGIDYSTKAIDLVTIPHEGDSQPEWHHMPLEGDGAFDRARDVANALHGRNSAFWDDILAVGIEHPGGHHRDAALRLQGSILSCIPARMLVQAIPPGSWKKAIVGRGNATPTQYEAWVLENEPAAAAWNDENACAAYCIAHAIRTLISTPRASKRASNIVRDGDTVFG